MYINSISENKNINLNQLKFLKLKKKIIEKKKLFIKFLIIFIYIIFLIKNELLKKILNKNNKIFIDKLNPFNFKAKIIKKNQKLLKKEKKLNIYDFIRPMEVLGHKKIRIGRKADGGYIILDDLKNIKIAYSFGINNEISFDKDLSDKNINVFMYDHTITNIPIKNSRLHWKKIGISGFISKNNNFKTLPELIAENGHLNEKNMILKLDVEFFEWEIFHFLPINTLKQFKYILGEFHFSLSKKIDYYFILKRLLTTHQIFHLHCNNFGKLIDLDGYKICQILEISYIQKKDYKFVKDTSKYPIKNLDYKNSPKKPDINYILNNI